jgi:hypothetical protein
MVAACFLAWVPQTYAQDDPPVRDLSVLGDYDIYNDEGWNGLATFASLAEGSGLQVLQRQELDWESLDNNDLLILLYPTNHLDPNHVVQFIRSGGRVLIADDFGAGESMFSKLGARRSTIIDADEFHNDQLFAPVAHPTGHHDLSRGVLKLTTNHPGAVSNLESGMRSVFEFSDGSTLVAEGTVGQGHYVILTDPSVLINRMLQFEGNLEFAINLLRFLAVEGSTDRVVILSRSINLSGEPHNQHDDGTWRGGASVKVSMIDQWLDDLNRWLFTARSLRIVTVIIAGLLGILAFITLPTNRQRALDGSWTKPAAESHRSLVDFYQQAGARTNYLLPAAIERDNVNAALEAALQRVEPLDEFSDTELLNIAHQKLGLNASRALRDLLPRLRNIPQRAQAASHWEPRHLGRVEFDVLHKSAAKLFDQLDANTDDET